MIDLKPCPFCGKNVKLEHILIDRPVTNYDSRFQIYCNKCDFGFSESIPGSPEFYPEEANKATSKLVSKWNRRAKAEL